jgi:hypothetical protein
MNQIESFRPNVPRVYGSAKEVTSRAISQGGGVARVAHMLGKGRSVTHAYSDPTHPTHIPYDKVRRMTEAKIPAFVEDLCSVAGGAYMPASPTNEALHMFAARGSVEITGFMAGLLTATADQNLGKVEGAALLEQIDAGLRYFIQCRVQLACQQANLAAMS